MSLYKTLASQFVQEIEDGKLSEGSRMPSLRQLAKQQAVSMSTAVSCYQELESQGWIHSRPQAGYYISARSKNTIRLSGRSLSVKYLKYTKASLFTLLTTARLVYPVRRLMTPRSSSSNVAFAGRAND